MALTHHFLLQEPACVFLHLPRETLLQQSRFPDLFHVLPVGLPPHSRQQQRFGMIHSAGTLESGLQLRGSGGSSQRGFGSCCSPSPTPLVAGSLPAAKPPQGNMLVPAGTSVSCPELPPATGSTAHSVPPRRRHLSWGHPGPGGVCHGSKPFGWAGGMQT